MLNSLITNDTGVRRKANDAVWHTHMKSLQNKDGVGSSQLEKYLYSLFTRDRYVKNYIRNFYRVLVVVVVKEL